MPTTHQLVSWIVIGGFYGMLAFSVAAMFHIEESKKREFRHGLLRWGPFVPESLLTTTGKKWAFARNLCALGFAGGGVAYGIVMAVSSA
jgi:hypothetical protein